MGFFAEAVGFGIVMASILALAGVGFTMQFAVTNVLNLAYAEVMGASGYVALICNHYLNIWLCVPIAALLGAALSYLLNRVLLMPFLRRGTRLFGMIIVTVGAGLVIENVILAITGASFYSYRMSPERAHHLGPFSLTTSEIVIICGAVAIMAGVHVLLRHTRLGIAMRGVAADSTLAQSCGMSTELIIDMAWLISGGLCGLSGVALFINLGSFTSATAESFLVEVVAVAVLGGIGQAYGAMLGAIVIGLATQLESAYMSPAYSEVIAFAALVIVLLFRPQGIIPELSVGREIAT
jgi:branched-chain amino acid transport system permease protein/neutral amino acid transport system permease protein